MPSKKSAHVKIDVPYIEDDSLITGEGLSLRWIPVAKIPDLLWEDNPKSHSLSELWESICKFGFIDPPKFDLNLKNRAGVLGAIQYGNGRSEAVHWGWEAFKRGDYTGAVPKGIGQDKEGNWYIPLKFGLDADSEAMAADFGIFHNTSTMLGGDFADGDIWNLFSKVDLLKVGKKILSDDSYEPLAMTGEEVDALLTMLNKKPDEDEETGESSGSKVVTCPDCGHIFTL